MKHHVERTSPKGQQFIGTCRLCGLTGLTSSGALQDCENVRGLSEDEAMVESILAPKPQSFREGLQHLINCHSMENGSDTPDFILADYLSNCLNNFDVIVSARERWYGRAPNPIANPPAVDR